MTLVVDPLLFPNFRVGRVREDAKFGDRIDGRLNHKSPSHAVEVVRARRSEIVGLRPLAVHRVRLTIAERAAAPPIQV